MNPLAARNALISGARRVARKLRGLRLARPVVEAFDRYWWTRTILAADVVDPDIVDGQGFRSVRHAVRAYVRGGFRRGIVLNPLLMERLVASQLSDVGRVPALYAYLVNDRRTIQTSVNWDAPAYAQRHPESLTARGGPLGHAWRQARERGFVELGPRTSLVRVPWAQIISASFGPAPIEGAPDAPIETLYVCEIASNATNLADALASVIALSDRPIDAVIRLDAPTPGDRTAAAQLRLWLPGVRVVDPGISLNLLEAATHAPTLLVRGPEADIDEASLRLLAQAGREGPVAPLWVGEEGTIISAGALFRGGRSFSLLAGHPSEDAEQLGPQISVGRIATQTYARPTRSASTTGARTLTGAVVRTATVVADEQTAAPEDVEVDTAILNTLLSPTDFHVVGWGCGGEPVLARSRSTVTLPDGARVPSLRWAIKIAAPPGTPGEYWGDTHFARGLASALRRLGQQVVIDAYAARDRATGHMDDVVLALRGPEPIEASPTARSLLWIISHPDEITRPELDGFARVFAASQTWATEASHRMGRPIEPLLQCTDALRFRPIGLQRTEDLVFVGTARGIARPAVVEPIRAGIPLRVYGPDWTGYIPASAVVARSVPNSELPVLYETAAAVLNDHWPAMQRAGFVSNRLFDVVAAGGRAISDDVAGITDIFEGAVRTFRDTTDLLDLLRGDLDAGFPAPAALARISSRIRTEHSFDARARVLLNAALSE